MPHHALCHIKQCGPAVILPVECFPNSFSFVTGIDLYPEMRIQIVFLLIGMGVIKKFLKCE